jgi:hypothetical protein
MPTEEDKTVIYMNPKYPKAVEHHCICNKCCNQTEDLYSKKTNNPNLNLTLMFIFRCIISISLAIAAGILTYQNASHWWIFIIVLLSIPYYPESNQK